MVNKINKKKVQTPQQQSPQHSIQPQPSSNEGLQYHNYCNVAPLLGDVVKQSGKEYQQTCMINGQNIQQQHQIQQQQNPQNYMFNGQNIQQQQQQQQQQKQQQQQQQQNPQAYMLNGQNILQQQQQQFVYLQQQLNNQQQQQQQQQQVEHDQPENNGGGHYYENSAAVLARLKDSSVSNNQDSTAYIQQNGNPTGTVNNSNATPANSQNGNASNHLNGSSKSQYGFSNCASGMGDYVPMEPKMFQVCFLGGHS